MLDQYVNKGRADALRRFGFHKEAMSLGPAGAPHLELGAAGAAPVGAPTSAAAGGGGVRGFLGGQWGAAKDLYGNLRAGLGGAATPEAGALARQGALGNLKTLAPSLLAGGALYMLHRRNQDRQEQQARQQAMMMGGGYPAM